MRVLRADHFVLTVRDIPSAVDWYCTVLGMHHVVFADGREAVAFGNQKLNLHQAGKEREPKAAHPTPGAADLCVISAIPINEVQAHLEALAVPVELGPVARTGATGPITSLYLRDPDQNLIEISTYAAGRPKAPDPYDLLAPVPTLSLVSGNIADGVQLATRHIHGGLGGGNQSPELIWSGAPESTRGFAVTCYDPDAPTGSGFWHWLLVQVPASCASLPLDAGRGDGAHLPNGAFHVRNDFGQHAYGGAYPPPGDPDHRYLFAVHALDTDDLSLNPDAAAGYAGFVLNTHTIARGVLRPTFRQD
jgi:Raf kinase inhibitor-like YbhB/YbcL family protein